ncbi:nucleotidyltransferase family protein [Sulfitobacter sp. HNIBRBA2951]|uniref:nucleotidyltransferase family protein n=1 Tax=Sulfitobacter aquimarinus TaxID=3158557 RepID=UPI0032DF576C
MIAVVILAAGASTRMRGRDKLLEEIDGVPLLRRQVLRAVATGAPVFVAVPPAPHARHDAIADIDATLVPVSDAADGMNASLSAGVSALPDGTKAAMIVLADMPDLTTDDMKTILQAVDFKSDVLIWRSVTQAGAQGHPIIFRSDLFDHLTALRGDAGGREVVRAHMARTQAIALPDDHARTDLDTPEAWAAWRAKRASI